jgi:hypothetical protein
MRRLPARDLDYLPIDELLKLIDGPYQSICVRILADNRALFETAQGSTYNHQAWKGGYIDHITDGMNFARHLYFFLRAFERRLPFTLSEALLVFFLHDTEKPWRIQVATDGSVSNRSDIATKEQFRRFREQKLAEYGLEFSEYTANALTYVEGEGSDYSSKYRVMNELAAFCHMVDVWSARGWYSYPQAQYDGWTGAGRFRTT